MKRPDFTPGSAVSVGKITDKDFLKKYPALVSYMTDCKWDDGKAREVSTISINFSTGSPTIGLSDHAMQRSVYTTAASITEALELLEEALKGETASWRAWKLPGKR